MSSCKDDPLTYPSSPITVVSSSEAYHNNNNNNSSSIGGGSAPGSFQGDNSNSNTSTNSNSVLHSSYDNINNPPSNDLEFGYLRADFRQIPLVGSVQFYHRHVFLCYKNPRNWPPRIEAAEFDRLPRLLSAALAARKPDILKETRLTICEGRDGTETSNGDVLIFPDMIRYRRLTHFDVDTFVEEVLIKDAEWLPGNPEKLKGSYIFVCCHGSRDRRCGVCGPPLVARFKEEVELRGLQGKVSISPCSHVGGHKYAGNVIIFGRSINKEISGHWYGYVTPDDVPSLLEQHVMKGEIVEWLWRGQMGLSEDNQRKAQESRLQNNYGDSSERSIGQYTESPDMNSPVCGSNAEANGCCQANGNSACCQNSSVADNENLFSNEGDVKLVDGKKNKKQLSRNNSYKGGGKRKVCPLPAWYEDWEREDTYAALAVVVAAVSVGLAYSCYKNL